MKNRHHILSRRSERALPGRPQRFGPPVTALALVILAAALAAARFPARTEAPEAGVLRAELANGLRVVVVRNALAPVATTVVNYLAGSNEAPPGFPGMAHAQEHMMFRGSPGLSADQLADISAALGGSINADTQQTVTQYFFSVPAQDLDLALHIEAIRMRGVLDSEDLWKEERGAIEQEVSRDLSSPQYVFYTQLLAALFKGTVYAHDALGTKASFDATTGAMLKDFYDKWYAPNNAVLVIAGDVQPDKVLETVKSLFGDIPSRKLPARPAVRLEPVSPENLSLTTDLPYGLALVCFRMPGYDSPDHAAAAVLSDVLNSQRGDLYALVPQGKALAAGFAFNALPASGLGFAYAAYPAGGDGPGLVKELKEILSRAAAKGVPPDLVKAAKRREATGSAFLRNSISGLAMAWSQAVAVEGVASPEDVIKAIQAVSPASVDAVAAKSLRVDQAITAVLTPQPSGQPVSSKGFGGPESFAPSKLKGVRLPDWAREALGRLEVPPSVVRPSVSTLANGLTLIVQTESIGNAVSLYGQVKNEPSLEEAAGREGVDGILDQLFDYGTETLDRLAFQKALDDIGASESAGTDFSLAVLPDDLERGVALLADNLLHPALPPAALEVVRSQAAAAAAGEMKSSDYLAGRALDEALLPAGDPGLRRATPATISSVTLPDIKDYYRRVFRPDMTDIVVIGKVEPEKVRTLIEKSFGGWSSEGPKPETELPALPPNKPSSVDVPDKSKIQDSVVLAETLGLTRFDADYYPLQLGNHVLGGGFYATRFYRDLREKRGLVYFVSSSFEIGKTRSFYKVGYGCDPDKAAEARTIIIRDLEEMRTTPVSPEELKRAKAMILREIPLAESSVPEIAFGLLARSLEGLPLDEPIIAARKYAALDAEAVRAAFAKWVRPGDLVEIIQGPAGK
jgi:zinc protease